MVTGDTRYDRGHRAAILSSSNSVVDSVVCVILKGLGLLQSPMPSVSNTICN